MKTANKETKCAINVTAKQEDDIKKALNASWWDADSMSKEWKDLNLNQRVNRALMLIVGVPLLFVVGLMFITPSNVNQTTTTSYSATPEPLDVTPEIEASIRTLLAAKGYRCNTMNKALPLGYRDEISVACNDYRYNYTIKNVAGTWIAAID